MDHWDLIVIGAGPGGLTAGLYGSRSGLKTLVLERGVTGGSLALADWVENYPGFPNGISGADLTDMMLQQCKKFGAEVKDLEEVVSLNLKDANKTVKTDRMTYSSGAVIIASGCHSRELSVPGEAEFRGKGVSYCALCDGAFFKKKRVLVVGGGNTAVMSALYLSNLASKVYLAHRRDQLRAEAVYVDALDKCKAEILWNTEVTEIKGGSLVNSVTLVNNKTNQKREMEVDGVFIFIGEIPNSKIASEAGVEVDGKGYVIVDQQQRTNIPGVYAVGDVTNCSVKQIGTAVGQAIVAVTDAFGLLKNPYYCQ